MPIDTLTAPVTSIPDPPTGKKDGRYYGLWKKANNGEKTAIWALQKFYGLDLDYSPGLDDGEQINQRD